MKSSLALIALFLSLIIAMPVMAKDKSTALKTLIEQSLLRSSAKAKLRNIKVTTHGDVIVEDAGNYYAVTLPNIEVTRMDGQTLDMGVTSINAIPSAEEGIWRIKVALATPQRVTNAIDETVALIRLPNQNIEAFWDQKADMLSTVFAQFKNVDIEHGHEITRIGNVRFNTTIKDIKYEAAQKRTVALQSWVDQNYAPESRQAVLSQTIGLYVGEAFNHAEFENIEYLERVRAEDGQSRERLISSLQKAIIDTSFKEKADNQLDVLANIKAESIKSTQIKDISRLGNFDTLEMAFYLKDIPLRESIAALQDIISAGVTEIEGDDPILAPVIAAAKGTGSEFIVSLDLSKHKGFGINSRLEMQGNNASERGGTGSVSIALKDYDMLKDAVMEALRSEAAQKSEKAAQLKNMPLVLGILENIAVRTEDEAGKTKLSFTAKLSEAGEITLNDMPLNQVMALAMPAMMVLQEESK